jgi:puromycin-sensitive aminopeptidase
MIESGSPASRRRAAGFISAVLLAATARSIFMDPYRLPRTVVPSRYDLRLEPDQASASFTGEVTITVTVHDSVADVFLNAAELTVSTAYFASAALALDAAIGIDEPAERVKLSFLQPLPPGEGRLHLRFSGTLNDKLRGFYRCRCKDGDGDSHWMAATQFEATDARRAFPCWDEPAFKAIFAATLVIDPGLTAVSNTPVLESRVVSSKRIVRFADSLPMSTYLVAFIVGHLEAGEPVLVGSTPVRVWCVPGKKHLARFGQEIAVASLAFFEQYYDRKYPGDKLDLIAIPDFAAGAMENMGAITFRETALLVDEATATHQEKERVADVVAHENAHMWFGDLVTMRWWNGLWLNEAFATFMEMLAVDAWKPNWQRWTTFGVSRSAALTVDGLHSSRPIEFPVNAPSDAEAMFDVLTYEKGASVLRMLEQYLGADVFRDGVRHYLRKHAFANTETNDLWESLAEASALPIPAILDAWIYRPGYPLLSASMQGNDLLLRQQRFSYRHGPPSDDIALGRAEHSLGAGQGGPYLWKVPVQVRIDTPAGPDVRRLLLEDEEQRIALPADVQSVLVNEGGHGFYRVRYQGDLLERLLDRLPRLAAIERFNLVNDAWAAALAGLMPLEEYLDLTARLRNDRDRNVWSVVLGSLATLARIVEEDDRPGLQRLVRDRLATAVAALGWQPRHGESELTGQLRGDLLRALGTLGDDPMTQMLAARVYTAGEGDASVLAAAISIVAHTGDATRYDEFLRRFRAARTPQEEQRYLLALANFRRESLVERTLGMTVDGTVRTQDAPFLIRALLLGVHSRARAWAFFQEKWEQMAHAFPGPGIRRLCEGVLGLTSPEWEQQVQAFFHERNINLGGKTLEQFLEQLHIAVVLRRREGEALRGYLRREAAR